MLSTECRLAWSKSPALGARNCKNEIQESKFSVLCNFIQGIAQVGRAPALGAGGWEFEALYPDQPMPPYVSGLDYLASNEGDGSSNLSGGTNTTKTLVPHGMRCYTIEN